MGEVLVGKFPGGEFSRGGEYPGVGAGGGGVFRGTMFSFMQRTHSLLQKKPQFFTTIVHSPKETIVLTIVVRQTIV